MSDQEYSGWTNYETWNVNLWLGDDEYFRKLAVDADDLYSAKIALQHYIEELAEMLVPGVVKGANFVADLFGGALSKVNWIEIAEHYRNDNE